MPKYWSGTWPKNDGDFVTNEDLNDVKNNIEFATIESNSVSFTVALTDTGTAKRCTNSSAIIITIPPSSSVNFPIGSEIGFLRQGAGTISFAPGSGVTLQSIDNKRRIKGQFASAAVLKVDTDTWMLVGSLEV
jgi:hypothetical protein